MWGGIWLRLPPGNFSKAFPIIDRIESQAPQQGMQSQISTTSKTRVDDHEFGAHKNLRLGFVKQEEGYFFG